MKTLMKVRLWWAVSLAFALSMIPQTATSQLAQDDGSAPDVPAQFSNLAEHGDPLAAHVGAGLRDYGPDGVRPCKHYQGIARGAASDGTPYFFLTRSRNRSNSCCEIWWQEKPGELLIVEMGSRGKDGERLRSNRLTHGKIVDDTAPPAADIGVKAIYFDGVSRDGDANGNDLWPKYWHPGGMQLLEDVLVVPLECTVGSNCLDKLYCGDNVAGVALIDVSTPEQPDLLLHQPLNAEFPDGLGVTAVIKDPVSNRYLFAFAWGDSRVLRFGWSDTDDLRTTTGITVTGYAWINPYPFDWNKWQTLNFVRDANGAVYLIGADNSSSVTTSGDDVLSLLRVDIEKLKSGQAQDAVEWVNFKQLLMAYHGRADVADLGDLDAASGFYISPTGQLIMYASHFKDSGADGYRIIEMGEFSNTNVSHTDTCGLHFPLSLGNPGEIQEGEVLQLDFTIRYIEPWVHMFAETNFENRSLMLDASDQTSDDHWSDFSKVGGNFWPSCASGQIKSGFNDTLQSFKFCGPPGTTLYLFDDDGFSVGNSSYPPVPGTGNVIARTDVRDHGSGSREFACEATSAAITWTAPATYDIGIDWGEGEPEQASRPWGEPTFVLQHRYLDDEPSGTSEDAYTILVSDSVGGQSAMTTTTVVKNVDPTVRLDRLSDAVTGLPIRSGNGLPFVINGLQVRLTGNFTDPGSLDTHSASADWGDGTTDELDASSGELLAAHIYQSPGTRSVVLTVTDDDLGKGTVTHEVAVVDAIAALSLAVERLEGHRALSKAADKLQGAKGGKAANGAIDLLARGNVNAALGQIHRALNAIAEAEARDPSLETFPSKPLLALSAKALALKSVDSAGARPASARKVAEARSLIGNGDASLAAHDYVAAAGAFERAARRVEGLR